MFRIGSALFIPAYLTVILYRPLASADNDGSTVLMAGERVVFHRGPASTHCDKISPFGHHVCVLNFRYTRIDGGHTGLVPSDIAGQLSRIPRSLFS